MEALVLARLIEPGEADPAAIARAADRLLAEMGDRLLADRLSGKIVSQRYAGTA